VYPTNVLPVFCLVHSSTSSTCDRQVSRHVSFGLNLICVQGKKLYLFTSRRRIGGVKVQIHSFLTSVMDRGEWLAERPVRFTPRKGPRYPFSRMGGPRNCSGRFEKEKDLLLLLLFELRIFHPVAKSLYRLDLCDLK
jgi:hypothetical protein